MDNMIEQPESIAEPLEIAQILFMRGIRDQLIQHMRRHDAYCHGGEECLEIANILAYLAHCLGASDRDIREFQRIFLIYDVECKKHGGCDMHRSQPL